MNNRLTESTEENGGVTTSIKFFYDNNGNQITKATMINQPYTEGMSEDYTISNASDNFVALYEYNCYNQLVGVDTNGVASSYTYSPDGLRHSKTVGGETTTFIYDNANVVEEITADGTNKYYRGIEIVKNDDGLYYLYNGQGDVSILIDSSGVTIANYEFDAYGNQSAENIIYNPFGYRGEYIDSESGLLYLRARMYDTETGRFINEDPARDGLNWYVYCGGNPIVFVDPWGLEYLVVSGSEEDNRYKYNFVETALKKINELKSLNDGEWITWIVSKTAYSDEALNAMNDIAYELGVGFVTIGSASEFQNYINSQDVSQWNLSQNRLNDPIKKVIFFSHGVKGAVELGYGQSNKNSLSINADIVKGMHGEAFDSPNTWFYSCNGATGENNSIAKQWHDVAGGFTGAYIGKTNYQYIMYPENYSSIKKLWSKMIRNIDASIDSRRSELGFSRTGSDYYPIPSEGTTQKTWGNVR